MESLISRMGHEHKLTLFSRKPLLVEGLSDQIIVNGLATAFDVFYEAAGCQILPVLGKGELTSVYKMLRLIGKKPLIMADLDTIVDNGDVSSILIDSKAANELASQAGHSSIAAMTRTIRTSLIEWIDKNYADIQAYAEAERYWLLRDTQADEQIARRRAAFAAILKMDQDAIDSLANRSFEWKAKQNQLICLLTALECGGCFILRRGTIEDYYLHSGAVEEGKPFMASQEINSWVDLSRDVLADRYADVMRALQVAAGETNIDEVGALQQLTVAIAAASLDGIKRGASVAKLKEEIATIFGAKSTLFSIDKDAKNLMLTLESRILEGRENFPMQLPLDANVVESVSAAFKNSVASNSEKSEV